MWFYNFPFVQTRHYVALGEVFDLRDDEPAYLAPEYLDPSEGPYALFAKAGEKDNQYTIKLLQDYLWPEFWAARILYVDSPKHEITFEDIQDTWNIKRGHIIRWLNESTERYSILIESLNQIKNKLMAQVQSTTTTDSDNLSLFNDTPQDGGNFESDNYVTNASKNTNSSSTTIATDAATPIARLKEVQDKLNSLYGRWADEFSRFVLH